MKPGTRWWLGVPRDDCDADEPQVSNPDVMPNLDLRVSPEADPRD